MTLAPAKISGIFHPFGKIVGFCTPIYTHASGVVVPLVTPDAHVDAFLPIPYQLNPKLLERSNLGLLSLRGRPSLFAFRDVTDDYILGDQPALSLMLNARVREVEYNPHVLYEIAQFVGDKSLAAQASDKISTHMLASSHPTAISSAYPPTLHPDYNYNMHVAPTDPLMAEPLKKALFREFKEPDLRGALSAVRHGSGADVLPSTERWSIKEIEERLRDNAGRMVTLYIYYYYNEYSGLKLIIESSVDQPKSFLSRHALDRILDDLGQCRPVVI